MQIRTTAAGVVPQGLVEPFAPVVDALDELALLGRLEGGVELARLLVGRQVRRQTGVHLAAKRERDGRVRHLGVRSVTQPLREPDVFGFGKVGAGLRPQDVNDGADAADRQPTVAAEARARVPGRADPVVLEVVVEVAAGVGAEDGVGLEDEQPLGGGEDGLVQPQVGEEPGDFLLGSDGHVGRDVGEVEFSCVDLFADGDGFVDELDGFDGAHEAEAPVGGHDGHEVQHERGEDGVGAVFNEEGDFGGVVGCPLLLCVFEGYFGNGDVVIVAAYITT